VSPTRRLAGSSNVRCMPAPPDRPISAGRIADELGDALPPASAIPVEAVALVEAVRNLVTAVVMTDVDAPARDDAARAIAEIAETLRGRQRTEPMLLVRHADGRVESLLQAGSGRLNPQAPPIEWVVRPTEPPPGAAPAPTEVRARCTFRAQHGGSPGRVYGGVLALALDEVLGVAARAGGASGMTVSLSVSLRAGTPLDEPVEIVGRFTHSDGRKGYASGEVLAQGAVCAEATAIYVSERADG
jgi:acyl-coenzyme A thioesterase PaaI-like protein